MRTEEFALLTPEQFNEIYRQWRNREDALSHERWEIARMTGMIALTGKLKRGAKVTDLVLFPWERERRQEEHKQQAEKSTKERFEQIKDRWK